MTDGCTLVYDAVQGRERWVKNEYVQLYPKIYLPVWVDGKRMYRHGQIVNVSGCCVKT
jgi:hypothetical protein